MNRFFYISEAFPPTPGGSSVINQNLINLFEADQYVAVTSRKRPAKDSLNVKLENVYYIGFDFDFLPRRLSKMGYYLSMVLATIELYFLTKRLKPTHIIAAYPELTLLSVSEFIARKLKIAFYPYLHDTLSEALQDTNYRNIAERLQKRIFGSANHVFVMSDGMKNLYKKKYNLETTAIRHIYPETIKENIRIGQGFNSAFWGGAIYKINHNALSRLTQVLNDMDFSTNMASNTSQDYLKEFDFPVEKIHLSFHKGRQEYLEALSRNDFLLLSLNWPDETTIHQEEIGTIFPTKTPEYLASGIPIIVHCPSNYFLSEFFIEHGCGIVINTKNKEEMKSQLSERISDLSFLENTVKNALKATQLFTPEENKDRLVAKINLSN